MTGAPAPRKFASAAVVGDGQSVMLWGGELASDDPVPCWTDLPCKYSNTGAIYSVTADAWTTLDPAGAPSPRRGARVASTFDGLGVLAWGGIDSSGHFMTDGASYRLSAGRWSALPAWPQATPDSYYPTYMLGNRLLVWSPIDAAVIDPADGLWLPVDPANRPPPTQLSAKLVGDPEGRIYVTLAGPSSSAVKALSRIEPTNLVWQRALFPTLASQSSTARWPGRATRWWPGVATSPCLIPPGQPVARTCRRGRVAIPTPATRCRYDAVGAVWRPVWQ